MIVMDVTVFWNANESNSGTDIFCKQLIVVFAAYGPRQIWVLSLRVYAVKVICDFYCSK